MCVPRECHRYPDCCCVKACGVLRCPGPRTAAYRTLSHSQNHTRNRTSNGPAASPEITSKTCRGKMTSFPTLTNSSASAFALKTKTNTLGAYSGPQLPYPIPQLGPAACAVARWNDHKLCPRGTTQMRFSSSVSTTTVRHVTPPGSQTHKLRPMQAGTRRPIISQPGPGGHL